MPTTHQTLCKRQEGYKTEQRKRKESYKTIVSGKSRNGEGFVRTAISHVWLQHTVWQKLLTGRELLTRKFHKFILKNACKTMHSQVARDLRARM